MGNGFGLSSAKIKMIALVSMLIDHTGAVIFVRFLTQNKEKLMAEGSYTDWYHIYRVLRDIGRMSFPLYCFLLVQGFYHTSSRYRYVMRMLVFAILSELPFDLAFNDAFHKKNEGYLAAAKELWSSNNVFWTLLLGLLAIAVIDKLRRTSDGRGEFSDSELHRAGRELGMIAAAVLAMCLAQFVIFADYGAAGVAVILIFYFYHNNPVIASLIAVFVLTAFHSHSEWFAVAAVFVIAMYDQTYGLKSRVVKNLFYWFYPVHLLALTGIAALLGLI